ncbi:hypothetical protein, partial [Pseudomonas aeruginosa]
ACGGRRKTQPTVRDGLTTTASDAIKNLVSAGFKNTPSKDGTVNVLNKGDKTYTFYSRSKTTGLPSAELKIGGNSKKNIAVKIRFENP